MTINITTRFDANITYTPYAIAKIVNELLAECEIEKVLPPQMFYTYAKKGMLNGIKESKRITGSDAAAWTEAYVLKHLVTEEA